MELSAEQTLKDAKTSKATLERKVNEGETSRNMSIFSLISYCDRTIELCEEVIRRGKALDKIRKLTKEVLREK